MVSLAYRVRSIC